MIYLLKTRNLQKNGHSQFFLGKLRIKEENLGFKGKLNYQPWKDAPFVQWENPLFLVDLFVQKWQFVRKNDGTWTIEIVDLPYPTTVMFMVYSGSSGQRYGGYPIVNLQKKLGNHMFFMGKLTMNGNTAAMFRSMERSTMGNGENSNFFGHFNNEPQQVTRVYGG